jgi:hypothetical protein
MDPNSNQPPISPNDQPTVPAELAANPTPPPAPPAPSNPEAVSNPSVPTATPAPIPPTETPAPAASSPGSLAIDAKVLKPKYLGIILAIELLWIVIRGGLVYGYIQISKIKKQAGTAITERDKLISVMVMALSPIIGQALYYFRLNKAQPQAAGVFNKLGWKILGIEILLLFLIVGIYAMVYGFEPPRS